MGADRRFFALGAENRIFTFKIDTTKTLSGATDGSENPLTFKLPLFYTVAQNFIVRVSDGRPDIAYTSGGLTLTFAIAGIYTISLIGRVQYFNFGLVYTDRLKIIEVNRWGNVSFGQNTNNWRNAFLNCSNLIIKATNGIKFPNEVGAFFQGIKGIDPSVNLSTYDMSNVMVVSSFFSGISQPLYSVLNPFFSVATTISGIYSGVDMSNISRIEVISNTVSVISGFLQNSNFHGELIINAPIDNYSSLLNGVINPPSLGKIDVRVATNFGFSWITKMEQLNVDATLIGWANTYDWTGVPIIARTCWFASSKYSNLPNVLAAKAFLESKGFTFTNLTMAT